MMKWIRWQGLVAFVVVIGTLMAFWLLFVDEIVKSVIEKTGMVIVGAQVDVKADVNLFPLAITLEELQVTNPMEPEKNSFECGRIVFSVDTLNLLRSKVIINEMAVEGMRFDTQRKRPGRVSKEIKEAKEKGEETLFGLPVQIPDVKTILKNENLESVKLIETTQAQLDKKEADWKQRIDQMPDEAKIKDYRTRIDKVKKPTTKDVFGMAGQLAEAKAISNDINNDIKLIRQTRNALTNDLADAKKIVEQAVQAPMNDVRRLRDKYSISPAGLANMSELLFGDQVSSWVRSGLLWHNRVQPIVERAKAQQKETTAVKPVRGKGLDIQFKEYRPLPDFLIDRTAVSAETTAGLLAGTIRNITPDQDILRLPLTFALTGEKLKAANSIALTGALNHINPLKSEDIAKFSMKGFKVTNFILSKHKELPIALQEALMDFDLDGSFTQALKANFKANFNSAKMNIGGDGSGNPFVEAVRLALSKVSTFSLSADMAGTLDNYKMKITSDLDRVLKTAVSSVVREKSAQLEQQLKTEIKARTGEQVKKVQASYGVLNGQEVALTNIQNQLNSLLQEALKSAGGKLRL